MFLKHFYFWLTSHFKSLLVPLGPPFREVFRLGGLQDAVFEGFWPFKNEKQKQGHFSIDFLSILVPSWRPTWLPKPSQNRPKIVPNRILGPTWRPRGPKRRPDPSQSAPGTNFQRFWDQFLMIFYRFSDWFWMCFLLFSTSKSYDFWMIV